MTIEKIGHIVAGWSRAIGRRLGLISLSSAEEKLSELRLKICNDCKFSMYKKWPELINDEDVEVNGLVCSKCGCPCIEKSLVVDEQCPESFW